LRSVDGRIAVDPMNKHVFCGKDNKVAIKAAYYAKKWAVEMDQPSHTTPNLAHWQNAHVEHRHVGI